MKNQSPATNDPANPLMKVAALQLERVYPDETNPDVFRLVATLNFKSSNDMHGSAKSKDGSAISVTFSLALRNATFQVEVSTDDDLRRGDCIRLSKVPFVPALATSAKVTDSTTRASGTELSAGGGLHIDPAKVVTNPAGAIGASANLKAGAHHKQARKRTVSQSRSTNNIAGTFSNNIAHFEIKSVANADLHDAGGHLSGEVFMTRNNKPIDACRVTRKPRAGSPPLIAEGSVYVMADDLVPSDPRFVDEDGNDIELRKIQGSDVKPWGDVEAAKGRLLKQIIRKHLLCNGMKIDGAKIEICRAHA